MRKSSSFVFSLSFFSSRDSIRDSKFPTHNYLSLYRVYIIAITSIEQGISGEDASRNASRNYAEEEEEEEGEEGKKIEIGMLHLRGGVKISLI